MFKSQTECKKILEEQQNVLLLPEKRNKILSIFYKGKRTITVGDFAFIQSTPQIIENKNEWLDYMGCARYVYENKEYTKLYNKLVNNEKNGINPIKWLAHFTCILPKSNNGFTYISDETLNYLESIYWELNENNHVIFHKNNKLIDLGKIMKEKESLINAFNTHFKNVIIPIARIANSYYVENTWDHLPSYDDFENSY